MLSLFLLLWGLAGALPPSAPPPTPPDLLTLFQDFWHWKTQDYPQFATSLGINDNTAGRLDSFTFAHFEQRKEKCEEFLARAESLEMKNLSPEDDLNLKLFKDNLNTFIDNFKYIQYFVPVTWLDGPQHSIRVLVTNQMSLRSYNDYQKLLSRYGEFPRQATEVVELMRNNIVNNLTLSSWSLTGVLDQFDHLLVPVDESLFYRPFLGMPLSITKDQKQTLREQARERIENDLLPAFGRIRTFIQDEYLPACRPQVGVSSLLEGESYYSALLRFHTSTLLSPLEIHNIGLTEIKRIGTEVQKAAAALGMPGKSLEEVTAALRDYPSQHFDSAEELTSAFRKVVYSTLQPILDRLFHVVPQQNLTVEGVENPFGLPAAYIPPSMDGSRLGSLQLNSLPGLQHAKYETHAVAMHKAVPGHHLHTTFTTAMASAPDFRKFVDTSRMNEAPSKFPLHTVFVEGWGLYAEFLGEELGLYEDPQQRLGRYTWELLQASRLVVDTGIHSFDWSREAAVEYLTHNTPLSAEAIENEVNRCITWPGQACAYKIGEIKIKELRQKSQNALGELFDIRDFHDVLLRCAGPLNIVETCISRYIEDKFPVLIDEVDEEKTNRSTDATATDKSTTDGDDDDNSDLSSKASLPLVSMVSIVITCICSYLITIL
ncbi:uncharacterized protein LOC143033796 isoform X2 [Oratosquilla oratoria]